MGLSRSERRTEMHDCDDIFEKLGKDEEGNEIWQCQGCKGKFKLVEVTDE